MKYGENAVSYALNNGASEVEVYISMNRNLQIQFTALDKNIKTVNSTGIGVQVALGKKLGMYSTSILNESQLERAVEYAIKIARVTPENKDWVSFNSRFEATPVKGVYDSDIESLEPIYLVEKINEMDNLVSDYNPKVRLSSGIVQAMVQEVTIINSNSDLKTRKSTLLNGYVGANAADGGKNSNGYESLQSRSLDRFFIEKTGLTAAERAVKFLHAERVDGGEMPEVIKNKVFGNIMGIMLSTPINADIMQKGASILGDRVGEKIASENITVFDDGRLPEGVFAKEFDDEGYPTQCTTIIEKGVFKNFIYDNFTALKDEAESTGNGSRKGYQTPVTPNTSNLILEKSSMMPEKIIEETEKGLYVDAVIGEWLSNAISGEVNATVTHGYLIENGELTKPVRGLVIAGNFFELLKNKPLIADDIENSNGNYCPSVKLEKMTVAGN